MELYPMKTLPVFKEMPWGGELLHSLYQKSIPSAHTGESWELSGHPAGESIVADGSYAGQALNTLCARDPRAMLGARVSGASLPVLFKLIDAQLPLSVQVHPDDRNAAALEEARNGAPQLGKTEMWLVLAAAEGAALYAGFREPLSEQALRAHILGNTLEQALLRLPVQAGDAVFIPAGTAHAIGAGLVIAEIQQSSDITYRMYDWGRVGLDGKPRTLHIEKALAVTDTAKRGRLQSGFRYETDGTERCLLPGCPLFGGERAGLSAGRALSCETCGESFHILFAESGGGVLRYRREGLAHARDLRAGDTVFIPAESAEYTVEAREGLRLLRFFVPDYERDFLRPVLAHGGDEQDARSLFYQS